MAASSHDPLVSGKIVPPSERSTGLVFTAVALIVAVLFRNTLPALIAALVLAVCLAALSFAAPALLRPLNLAWFRLSLLLHKVVNPVVMLAIFGLVFVPMGLVMQILRDPLLRRRRSDLGSYWVKREPAKAGSAADGSSMRNQF
jgi:hypothetical protein